MKILVCFKAIADFSLLSEQDWITTDSLQVDTKFVKQIFNCFDQSALEMALKLSELVKSYGHSSELTALTIDNQKADQFLTHLFAVQYNKSVRINCDKNMNLEFNPLSVSHAIAAYNKKMRQQLIFLGTQGGEGDNCQTGMLLAERLGWPCIRNVTGVEALSDSPNIIKVTSETNSNTLVQNVTMPLVLIIGNTAEAPYLRVPTLYQKLEARNKKISTFSFSDLGLKRKTVEYNSKTLIGLHRQKSFRQCTFIEGDSAKAKALQLYDNYLKKRLIS